MSNQDTTSIDEQIREMLFNWHKWRDYYYSDLQEQVITDDEWKVIRDKIDYDATEKIKALISDQVAKARGCTSCGKLTCENCERLWQT